MKALTCRDPLSPTVPPTMSSEWWHTGPSTSSPAIDVKTPAVDDLALGVVGTAPTVNGKVACSGKFSPTISNPLLVDLSSSVQTVGLVFNPALFKNGSPLTKPRSLLLAWVDKLGSLGLLTSIDKCWSIYCKCTLSAPV